MPPEQPEDTNFTSVEDATQELQDSAYKQGAKDALQSMENVIDNYIHQPFVRDNVRHGLLRVWHKLCN